MLYLIYDSHVLAVLPAIVVQVIWVAIAVGLSYAISQLTQKKLDVPHVDPDELDVPEIEEGAKYTIGFGLFWVENPVIGWWGDVASSAVFDHYTVNKWGNNKRVYYVTGWMYYMGELFICCQGATDGPKQIKIEQTVLWPTPNDPDTLSADGRKVIDIDEPNLWGGPYEEGGIQGTVRFQYGESTQVACNYLKDQLGDDITGYRGLTTMVLEHIYIGTSPYAKTWKVLLKRTDVLTDGTSQWYPSRANINNSMNAVHLLRECYTNPVWGFGKSEALFPEDIWQAAADVLYTEEFGLSMKWEGDRETLEAFVNRVLGCIDAKIYEEPSTGEYILVLIRDDYDPDELEIFDEESILSVTDFARDMPFECANTFIVRYWNYTHNEPATITDHDLALMDAQGTEEIPVEYDYTCIVDGDLAARVLAREKFQITSLPASMTVKATRKLNAYRPGQLFKLTWGPLNLSEKVLRIHKVIFGPSNENWIKFVCTEDVFAAQLATIGASSIAWTGPLADPENADDAIVQEVPFYDVYRELGSLADALALDGDTGYMMAACSRPITTGGSIRKRHVASIAIVYVRDNPLDDFAYDGTVAFSLNAAIVSDLPANADDIEVFLDDMDTITAISQIDLVAGDYALIGTEIVKVKEINPDGESGISVVLARGCLDTVPAFHPGTSTATLGSRLWFLRDAATFRASPTYNPLYQPAVKFLVVTSRGVLDLDDADVHNCDVMNRRLVRPYPPGKLLVNGQSYPQSFTGALTVSWSHRDRTQQIDEIVEHSAGDIGPEAGTTYTIEIYDQNNVHLRTVTDIAGTTYTYSLDDEASDCALNSGDPYNSQLRFVLYSVRDGYNSWQSYDVTVARA